MNASQRPRLPASFILLYALCPMLYAFFARNSQLATHNPHLSVCLQLQFPRLGLSQVIAGLLIFSHGIHTIQFPEPVVYQGPDTILVDIDFAFSVIGTAAGSVDQAFVTVGHRADAAGLTDDAGSALGTDFIECPESRFFTDEHRIDGRHHHFL